MYRGPFLPRHCRSKWVLMLLFGGDYRTCLERGRRYVGGMDEAILSKKALRLPAKERALLADALLVSLDDDATKVIEAEWVSEAEDRLGAYRRGELKSKDGSSVLKSLKEKYGK